MVPHDPAPLSPHDSRLSLSDPYTHSLSDPDTYSPRVLRPGSGDSGGGCRGSGSGSGCGDYCHHRLSLSESAGAFVVKTEGAADLSLDYAQVDRLVSGL